MKSQYIFLPVSLVSAGEGVVKVPNINHIVNQLLSNLKDRQNFVY